jgi:hypothetical protein
MGAIDVGIGSAADRSEAIGIDHNELGSHHGPRDRL